MAGAVILLVLGALLSAVCWRLGGMFGAPWRYGTALIVTVAAWPVLEPAWGQQAWWYGVWFGLGELSGWKPKYAKPGQWWRVPLYGLLIGGVGALLVPLSEWLSRQITIPIPANTPRWAREILEPGAQNELWMGLFSVLLTPLLLAWVFTALGWLPPGQRSGI